MADTVFFLHPDPMAAASMAGPLTSRGFAVEISSPAEPSVGDTIAESAPVALVISLDGQPDLAREIAAGVLADARIPRPLLVFVGGTPNDIQQTRDTLPFSLFLKPDEIVWSLTRLMVNV